MKPEHSDRVVGRFTLVTLVLPAAVTTVTLIVQFAAWTQAAARIPPYGRGSDAVAGGGPSRLPLVLLVALGFGLSCLPSLRRGDRGPAFRLFGAEALGISVLLATTATSPLLHGFGTTSPDHNRMWLSLLAGLAAGVAAALVGWFLQPGSSQWPPICAATPLELAPSEVAAWMHTAFLPVPALAVITAVTTVAALKAAFGWATGDRHGGAAILTAVTLLLLAVLATTAAFRVRVDGRGLTVRSVLGVPRFQVAMEEVDSVAVVDARSLGVSGSWGIRILPRRLTIVTRSTTGIRVTRRDGRIFFVTVDDAATGAALLIALAARAAAAQPSADNG